MHVSLLYGGGNRYRQGVKSDKLSRIGHKSLAAALII
jgi:hypothetical protein